MCQEDQLALLKGGCTEMMILRSALTYDPEKDLWKIPHSQDSMSKIKTDVLKHASGNLYAEHARFVKDFDPKWRDENIILILSAIALFTPDRPRVVHSDVIKLEQVNYLANFEFQSSLHIFVIFSIHFLDNKLIEILRQFFRIPIITYFEDTWRASIQAVKRNPCF